jgi:hypothetical protein
MRGRQGEAKKAEEEKLAHGVSMTSGPERPDAAKGDQRSPDAMD